MVEPTVNAASKAVTRAFRIFVSAAPALSARRGWLVTPCGDFAALIRSPHCAPNLRSAHACFGCTGAAGATWAAPRGPRLEPLFLFGHEDLALAGVVGLADDALFLHALHQRGGAVVADLQPALDVAGRGLAVAGDDLHCLGVEVAALRLAHAGRVEHGAVLALLALLVDRDGLEVLR